MRALRMAVMAAALAGTFGMSATFAQTPNAGSPKYPERPITVIVPYGPGTLDTVTRMIGDALKNKLGQPVVVENKPGAFGNIGWIYAARQPADGYTIALINNSLGLNPHLYKMDMDVLKDFTPIARAVDYYFVLMVTKSLPVNSVKEFFDYAKTQKNPLHFGVASMSGQVGLAELVDATGAKFDRVNYKGGSEMARAVISGEVAAMFTILSEAVGQKDATNVKLLAVSSLGRAPQLPNVPAMADTFPGYKQVSSAGYAFPSGTPRRYIELLNKEVVDAVNAEPMKSKLVQMGLEPAARNDPDSYAKTIADEYARYGRIVKTYNLKAD